MNRMFAITTRSRRRMGVTGAAIIGAALDLLFNATTTAGPPINLTECIAHACSFWNSETAGDWSVVAEGVSTLLDICRDTLGGGDHGSGVDMARREGSMSDADIRRQHNRLELAAR